MKRFDFALQKILDLREFYEKEAEIDLARAISVKEGLDTQLQQIALEKSRINQIRTEIELAQLIVVEQYVKRLDVHKEKVMTDLAQAELLVERKRVKMLEALQKRKVLSLLREKKVIDYKKEVQKAEDDAIDDIRK